MDQLSAAVPLLARVYPNGQADINQFQQAGGMAVLVHELRRGGLLNEDVVTIMGEGLEHYEYQPTLEASQLFWRQRIERSHDTSVLSSIDRPHSPNGGLRLLRGNLGRAVIKVSAVAPEQQLVEAPARVFESQQQLMDSFARGELFSDHIAVVRFQGAAANGMPELHKLTPLLGVAQDRGHKVALVTDGRMSGASGKVPAAIHLSPEASAGGMIARIRDGDMLRLDAAAGTLELLVDDQQLNSRTPATQIVDVESDSTLGRGLFSTFRESVAIGDKGAAVVNPNHMY